MNYVEIPLIDRIIFADRHGLEHFKVQFLYRFHHYIFRTQKFKDQKFKEPEI